MRLTATALAARLLIPALELVNPKSVEINQCTNPKKAVQGLGVKRRDHCGIPQWFEPTGAYEKYFGIPHCVTPQS
jgi:hypothetical protein